MKTALFVVMYVCLTQAMQRRDAQYANFSLPNALLEKGAETLRDIAEGILKGIQAGQAILREYSYQSVNYTAILKNNSKHEIFDMYAVGDKAIADALTTIDNSNGSTLACFTEKRQAMKNTLTSVGEGLAKCTITKMSQFADLGVELALLGNVSVHALLQMKKSKAYCDTYKFAPSRIACVALATGKAGLQATSVAAQVALKTARAASLMWNLRKDVSLCLEAKVGIYKQEVAEIPIRLAVCTGSTILG